MTPHRIASLLAVAAALTLGACGSGGDRSGEVSLLVTRDHGARVIGQVQPAGTTGLETILSYLRSHFDVGTRYGGRSVAAIDGHSGGREAGRHVDWFYYVNGVEAEGAPADTELHPGDRVWWDLHDWDAAQSSPAVVGSYPEPFVNGLGGKRWPTRVECIRDGDKEPCEQIAERLGEAGVLAAQSLISTTGGTEQLRVVVGPWADVRSDYAAQLIETGPRASGVFATFSSDGSEMRLLDARGKVVRRVGPGGGLIAATRWKDQPPTWFVTGTDAAGVRAAIAAFDEGTLANRFALAVQDGRGVPLPVGDRPR